MSAAAVRRIGVVGAGTMGAGIAQVAALAAYETHLHDPYPEALERGLAATPKRRCSASTARPRWTTSLPATS